MEVVRPAIDAHALRRPGGPPGKTSGKPEYKSSSAGATGVEGSAVGWSTADDRGLEDAVVNVRMRLVFRWGRRP